MVYHTNENLAEDIGNSEDIGKVISGLDPNKALGHDKIIIHMLKMCSEFIHKPLQYISRALLNDVLFSSKWEKAKGVSIYKKDD